MKKERIRLNHNKNYIMRMTLDNMKRKTPLHANGYLMVSKLI